MAGPVGPRPVGPRPVGPGAAGPEAVGPEAVGPEAAGPEAAGPEAAGPEAAGAEPVGPGPVLGDRPGSFEHDVLTRRHRQILAEVNGAHPYGPGQRARLDDLRAEILTGVMAGLPGGSADARRWQRWSAEYLGRPWTATPFLFAESYFYRRLLHAVGYFAAGPWRGVDPFAPLKAAQPTAPAAAPRPGSGDRQSFLLAALWGNRADLGFGVGVEPATNPPPAAGRPAARGGLVADDSAAFWAAVDAAGAGGITVVADNAGTELVADLLLADRLLTDGAARVDLHVKPHPTFVSDAVAADLAPALAALTGAGPPWAGAARRLLDASATGRLELATHWFHTAPLPFADLPADLAATFGRAGLVVFKGDLNYRRLVGDLRRPATADFARATDWCPAPAAAVRTVKSNVVLGLDPTLAGDLERSLPHWRTTGTYALIQVRR